MTLGVNIDLTRCLCEWAPEPLIEGCFFFFFLIDLFIIFICFSGSPPWEAEAFRAGESVALGGCSRPAARSLARCRAGLTHPAEQERAVPAAVAPGLPAQTLLRWAGCCAGARWRCPWPGSVQSLQEGRRKAEVSGSWSREVRTSTG